MAGIEIKSSTITCHRCGTQYPHLKGYFHPNYSYLNKGAGYLPYCRKCVEDMFIEYYGECGDMQAATRQMCRKLDLYWNDKIYEAASKQSATKTIITTYLSKINTINFAGKSYDDTLKEEGSLWDLKKEEPEETFEIQEPTEDIKAFWGPGYTPEMYAELEQRLSYYKSQMGDTQQDIGTDALLRQICMLEIDINKSRAAGVSVDKMVSNLNSLISSLSKPTKKADDINSSTANTPFGVWIKRWEDERPLPEIDDSLKDVDGIIKYVLTWVYGHIAHMLKVKNSRTKLYDEAIAKLRVDRPEYDDDDDESMLEDIFGSGGDDDS